jgi:hypothetical protein
VKLPQNHLVGYLLWFISMALMGLCLIAGRSSFMAVATAAGSNRWILSFLDRFGILVLGLLSLILVIYFEHYYRTGADQRRLWQRFARVTLLQIAFLAASFGLSWLATYFYLPGS